MPLNKASGKVKVVAINGGRNLHYKLSELGILVGSEFEILSNIGGPLLLDLNGCRYGLGRGMAEQIDVEEIWNNERKK